jgi:hypothetical protein
LIIILINIAFLYGKVLSWSYPFKLISNLFIMGLILENKELLDGKSIFSVLNYSVFWILISFLLPYIFDVGNTIYAGGIGYKAFYFSQNELAAVIIILFYFVLYKITLNANFSTFVQLVGLIICMILLNSKSGLISLGIGITFICLRQLIKRGFRLNEFLVLIFLVLIFAAQKNFFMEQLNKIFLRQNSLYSTYSNSWSETLFSGRTTYLSNAYNYLLNSNGSLFRFLFGNGFCSNVFIEMDFFDLFFYLGIFGLLFVIVFIKWVLKLSLYNFKSDNSFIRIIGFFIIIGYSIMAGHVLFTSFSGYYFILLCCFNIKYRNSYE